jgi:hypothetical protein
MAAPSLQVDVTDPDARVILEAVVQKLANASVDPQEKAGNAGCPSPVATGTGVIAVKSWWILRFLMKIWILWG